MTCETMWVVLSSCYVLLIELEEGHAIESDEQEFEPCLFPLASFSLFYH